MIMIRIMKTYLYYEYINARGQCQKVPKEFMCSIPEKDVFMSHAVWFASLACAGTDAYTVCLYATLLVYKWYKSYSTMVIEHRGISVRRSSKSPGTWQSYVSVAKAPVSSGGWSERSGLISGLTLVTDAKGHEIQENAQNMGISYLVDSIRFGWMNLYMLYIAICDDKTCIQTMKPPWCISSTSLLFVGVCV